jgi:hypothetical protein
MRRRLYIPTIVKDVIRTHISSSITDAVHGYSSAAEDEDTMTGHLGAKLRTGWQQIFVPAGQGNELPGRWGWSMIYYKFRGRGPGATEGHLGADGEFELNFEIGTRVEKKSLLFQAKMDGAGGTRLLEQCIKLSTWREAAFVLNYADSEFSAFSLDDVIGAGGDLHRITSAPSLSNYLGGAFLECDIGDTDLRYDATKRTLIWRAINGEMIATRFSLKHRIGIKVRAPRHGESIPGVDRMIEPSEIHDYRMEATDEDILKVAHVKTVTDIKRRQRRLAMDYHPDRFSTLDELYRQILTRRMQEINDAFARIMRSK